MSETTVRSRIFLPEDAGQSCIGLESSFVFKNGSFIEVHILSPYGLCSPVEENELPFPGSLIPPVRCASEITRLEKTDFKI